MTEPFAWPCRHRPPCRLPVPPLLRGLPQSPVAGVWNRTEGSARQDGREPGRAVVHRHGPPGRRDSAPVGIVSVSYSANGEVGLKAVERGLHVLLETPIAHKLSEADAIIGAPARKGWRSRSPSSIISTPTNRSSWR